MCAYLFSLLHSSIYIILSILHLGHSHVYHLALYRKSLLTLDLRQRDQEIVTNHSVNEPQTLYRSSSLSTYHLEKRQEKYPTQKASVVT